MEPTTAEDLVEDLRECAERDIYFEIAGDEARILLDYIQNLIYAAEDDRGVL